MTKRWTPVNTTMIANSTNAMAAATPQLWLRNAYWYERYAGVNVVFAGLPWLMMYT